MCRPAHQEQRIVYLKNKQIYDIIRWGSIFTDRYYTRGRLEAFQEGTREKNSRRAGLAYASLYDELNNGHGDGKMGRMI